MRTLVKAPVPVPSVVLVLLIVGFDDVLQQTPLDVTGSPPSLEMLPPDIDEVGVIDPGAEVVKVGRAPGVLKMISFPYAVPPALVA